MSKIRPCEVSEDDIVVFLGAEYTVRVVEPYKNRMTRMVLYHEFTENELEAIFIPDFRIECVLYQGRRLI